MEHFSSDRGYFIAHKTVYDLFKAGKLGLEEKNQLIVTLRANYREEHLNRIAYEMMKADNVCDIIPLYENWVIMLEPKKAYIEKAKSFWSQVRDMSPSEIDDMLSISVG